MGSAARGLGEGSVATVVGVVRNIAEAATTLAGGVKDLAAGRLTSGLRQVGLALVKLLLQTPVDAVLMLGGRVLSAVQTLGGVEPVGRPLREAELEKLRPVFGDSIDWSKVTIKEGTGGLLTMPRRPFTHGNTIYVPPPFLPLHDDLLVHELVHVWQHQHGGTDYMSEALYAQYFGDGYDVAKGLREGRRWSELNREQQAELIEIAFKRGYFSAPEKGFSYAGRDWSDYLQYVTGQLRAGRGAP